MPPGFTTPSSVSASDILTEFGSSSEPGMLMNGKVGVEDSSRTTIHGHEPFTSPEEQSLGYTHLPFIHSFHKHVLRCEAWPRTLRGQASPMLFLFSIRDYLSPLYRWEN